MKPASVARRLVLLTYRAQYEKAIIQATRFWEGELPKCELTTGALAIVERAECITDDLSLFHLVADQFKEDFYAPDD